MEEKRIRPGVWLGVVGLLTAVAVVVFVLESRQTAPRAPEAPPAAGDPPPPDAAAAPEASSRAGRGADRPATGEVQQEVPYIEGLVYGEIDLREARELMPDNIYWEQGSPTKDPEELARRDEERRRRNEEYGRVLSGDASEEEVQAYYDYKTRVSTDYLEFSEFMARRYRESDNEQFVGLLELAMKMHAAKLQQLPAEREEALARSRERAKAREDWQRQKEEFGDPTPPPGEEPLE